MPRRYQKTIRQTLYKILCQLKGEYCIICRYDHRIHRKKNWQLEIDHADNNKCNDDLDNINLVCKEHNLKLRQIPIEQHIQIINRCAARNYAERMKLYGNPVTKQVRETVDYMSGPAEMQVNRLCELKFREWIINEVERLGKVERKEAINSGAAIAGCSQITTKRYLEKMISSVEGWKEEPSDFGPIIVKR